MPGYLDWASGPFFRDLALDGRAFRGFDLSDDPGPHASRLPMADGSAVTQAELVGDTGPLHRASGTWSIGVDVAEEDDYHAVLRAERAQAVPVWLEMAETIEWVVYPAQTLFSTLRHLPYGGAVETDAGVVTEVTHPMEATVDGVVQTIIYTGTPSPGQVKVSLAAGAQWRAITTPTLSTGSRLALRYYPLIYGLVRRQGRIPVSNGLAVVLSIEECNPGRWD